MQGKSCNLEPFSSGDERVLVLEDISRMLFSARTWDQLDSPLPVVMKEPFSLSR